MENKDLKQVYDSMHSQGSSSWFGQGEEERELILKMGEPWEGKIVMEIGCGEGDLTRKIWEITGRIFAIDYSAMAIEKARKKHGELPFYVADYKDYKNISDKFNRIVMQGVLEHLDDPFTELKWMMENLLTEKGDVITSSPCFLNPRGIVWMALNMIGAVMSKTDLHFLNTWNFEEFCGAMNYGLEVKYCDNDWGNGVDMYKDLEKRLPLALKDGNIKFEEQSIDKFLNWLLSATDFVAGVGATAVYRISK